ncbi:hypothetical protein KAFR_0H03090 [Kazachstania africana CBS 2517]|uniref:Large ribosomal subunit protein bL27m n=1 Tax=Kazachstania africana (strain ATCC 22294 / BCRC 22015 / CBS 2517 / CECT 1963 / NBRC 1671 / NRRL Y-8276) TaxID=1071382 RepID=H2AZG3_KAZAF|nr:hypothetical protein KAFR_0H03090 [Kazachstania africana CBS 2517]CCF59719.1 hypothetical protein KAFR_0H03090 [Kazachstania africana CBS 2517]
MFGLSLLFSRRSPCSIIVQIRTSTKRASGSRTSMKDSAGRRLGPKKYEGQSVKPGEIIMRQRGTKFYPGEHVGIGKDHTIYALEPGIVRYYLDPFHPKRKFIGVALGRGKLLPTPHFAPRSRRFGHVLLDNKKAAIKEEEALPRKLYMVKDSICQEQKLREEKRKERAQKYSKFITEELELNVPRLDSGLDYLLRLRSCLRNGFNLEDAQCYSEKFVKKQIELKASREQWDAKVKDDLLEKVNNTVEILNKSISFDNKFRIIRFISAEEKSTLKVRLIENLKELVSQNKLPKIVDLFNDASHFLSLSEEVRLRRMFLKPLQTGTLKIEGFSPSSRGSRARYNYDTNKIEAF